MNKKFIKTILFSILFIILTLNVNAIVPTPLAQYELNNDATDEQGFSSGTFSNSAYITNYPSYNTTGDGATHSAVFDGDDAFFDPNFNICPYLENAFTMSFWAKTTEAGNKMFGGVYDGTRNIQFGFTHIVADSLNFQIHDGSSGDVIVFTNSSIFDGNWNMITWVKVDNEPENWLIYFNGVLHPISVSQTAGATYPLGCSLDAYFGSRNDAGGGDNDYNIDADLDSLIFWNETISSDQVIELYNLGIVSGNDAPIVNLTSPVDDDHTSDTTPVFSYLYFDADADDGNCSLIVADVFSGDDNLVASGTTVNRTINHTITDGVYEWYVNCTDGTVNTKSEVFNLTIDTVNPVITWTVPLNDNSSIYTTSTSDFNTDINLSDTNLFAFNFTVHNSTGGLIQTAEIINLNVTSHVISENIDLTSLNIGVYTVTVTVSDDHTANSWTPNKIDTIGDRLKIDDFISIMPENFDIDDLTYKLLSDRITYSFFPSEFSPSLLSYEVECDEGLHYRPNSDFKGLFVCGRFWLDFENPDDFPVTVEIISYKKAIVTTRASSFNSIGGLNIVTESRSFTYAQNISLSDPSPVDDFITYKDYVDFSVIGNFSLNASCFLNIDGSYNASQTTNGGNSINITYLNISFDDGSYNYSINCVDAISDEITPTFSFLVVHANCTDIGTVDSCSIYDNATFNHVFSPSGCDVDFNETTSCNYCIQDLQTNLGSCVDNNQTVDWVDDNFISCCLVTGIVSDCSILFSPYNITTSQSCDENLQDFTCDIATNIEFKDRMPFSCIMPTTQEYTCLVNVYEDDRLLQTNPEQTIYATSILGTKKTELREFFTTNNGLLNAYFTNKNIEVNNAFRVDAICSNGTTTIYSQNDINAFYDKPTSILNRAVWTGENATTIIIVLLLVLAVLSFIGYAWNKARGRR